MDAAAEVLIVAPGMIAPCVGYPPRKYQLIQYERWHGSPEAPAPLRLTPNALMHAFATGMPRQLVTQMRVRSHRDSPSVRFQGGPRVEMMQVCCGVSDT